MVCMENMKCCFRCLTCRDTIFPTASCFVNFVVTFQSVIVCTHLSINVCENKSVYHVCVHVLCTVPICTVCCMDFNPELVVVSSEGFTASVHFYHAL